MQTRTRPSSAADSPCDRDVHSSQTSLHHPARNTQVEPGTIRAAAGGPRTSRVNHSTVARVEQDTGPVLPVASDAENLGDDNAEPIFRAEGVTGPLGKGKRTGREAREPQSTYVSNINRPMKGRFRKSNAAITADLFRIPLPCIDAVGSRHKLGRKQLRHRESLDALRSWAACQRSYGHLHNQTAGPGEMAGWLADLPWRWRRNVTQKLIGRNINLASKSLQRKL